MIPTMIRYKFTPLLLLQNDIIWEEMYNIMDGMIHHNLETDRGGGSFIVLITTSLVKACYIMCHVIILNE